MDNRIKKIGILTHYYQSNNYGGLLQSFALVYYLNNNDYLAEQISYNYFQNKSNKQENKYNSNKDKKHIVYRIVNKFFFILTKKRINLRNKLIAEFRELIKHSCSTYNDGTIVECNNIYDAFIVGSDQVWHPAFIKTAFFLEFAYEKKRKIAYAASISVKELNPDIELDYQTKIQRINYISLREDTFIEKLVSLTNKPVSLVVDPVFLLDKCVWSNYTKKIIDNDYLFCYFLENNKSLKRIARIVSKQLGLKIVYIPHPSSFCLSDALWMKKKMWNVAPLDFVSLIKNASYIITDSFHGCAFSVIFEKQFIAVSRKKHSEMDCRMTDLLDLIVASNHFISDIDNFNLKAFLSIKTIDYSENSMLKDRINKSKMFINNSLK